VEARSTGSVSSGDRPTPGRPVESISSGTWKVLKYPSWAACNHGRSNQVLIFAYQRFPLFERLNTMICRIQRILVCAAIASAAVFGQAGSTLGVVTKIDAATRQIVLKTDAGAEITVMLQPTATFRRVAPGETDLRNAATIAITDINSGGDADRGDVEGRHRE
jgi:hypothetical protein